MKSLLGLFLIVGVSAAQANVNLDVECVLTVQENKQSSRSNPVKINLKSEGNQVQLFRDGTRDTAFVALVLSKWGDKDVLILSRMEDGIEESVKAKGRVAARADLSDGVMYTLNSDRRSYAKGTSGQLVLDYEVDSKPKQKVNYTCTVSLPQ